jgi:hypothetical protein
VTGIQRCVEDGLVPSRPLWALLLHACLAAHVILAARVTFAAHVILAARVTFAAHVILAAHVPLANR